MAITILRLHLISLDRETLAALPDDRAQGKAPRRRPHPPDVALPRHDDRAAPRWERRRGDGCEVLPRMRRRGFAGESGGGGRVERWIV